VQNIAQRLTVRSSLCDNSEKKCLEVVCKAGPYWAPAPWKDAALLFIVFAFFNAIM